MDWTALFNFVQSAGSVLVALVVLVGMVYGGHRFIWMPSQKQNRACAEANRDAAREHAIAARAHANAAASNEKAAQFNATTSEANARTAAHLERLTEMLLDRAIGKPQS